MSSIDEIIIQDLGSITARVNLENGQLFSIAQNGVEYMHPGGKPNATEDDRKGWGNSELVMFPVVGKAMMYEAAGQFFPMSQHGLVRHLPFHMVDAARESVLLQQCYEGMPVTNTKYKKGSGEHPRLQGLPYILEKSYAIDDDVFSARFSLKNLSQERLPYDWGWHPAFAAEEGSVVRIAGSVVSMSDLQARAQRAGGASKHEADGAVMETPHGRVELLTDAPYVQLWSPPGSDLVCIEPITKRPGAQHPTRVLGPGDRVEYAVEIKIL